MTKVQEIKILLISCFLLFVAMPVFAAEIRVDGKNREIKTGEQFTATIFLNTEESINALEGQLAFPADVLELVEIQSGNSIVIFWIDKPKVEADKIFFSGIIPGGFTGENGLILSVLFQAKKPGAGSIMIQGIKVLKNDGVGSTAAAITSDFQFAIVEGTPAVLRAKAKDQEPPESFKPEIARDSTIFDGEWFLVFATQDKGLGIGRYEIKETRSRISGLFSKWISSESPYALRDQKLRSYIFVKAVDKAGNVRIEKILPRNPLRWYERWEIWIIIVLGLVIAYAVYKATRSKRQGARK